MSTNTDTTCPRVGRLFRGCHWEPRYDVAEPALCGEKLPPLMSGDVSHLVRRTTYVRDVCRTCGVTKERANG